MLHDTMCGQEQVWAELHRIQLHRELWNFVACHSISRKDMRKIGMNGNSCRSMETRLN